MKHEEFSGGCLCGYIRYTVVGPTGWRAGCCCDSCTHAAGAPAMVWSGFMRDNFKLTHGELTIYESSPGVRRGFCGVCGTTLTYQKNPDVIAGAQDDVYVSVQTLDDPAAFPPTEYVYYGERRPWFSLDATVPLHETISPENQHRMLATMTVHEG